ncbi:MAG TPA: hypothetical protein VFW00_10010 [Rhodocyclaceae bacterium]|nr:hypothetical protein [Rhodocyclaceae bacterium]
MRVFKNEMIMGAAMALSIGFAAQAAQAASDYSNANAFALRSSGTVMGRSLCGGANAGAPDPCDEAWQEVDEDDNIKFIQAGGNMLFEVYPNGQTWIKVDPFNPGSTWINAGVDAGLTSPTQLTVGRNNVNLTGANNVYKATGGKLFQWLSGSSWQELTAFSAKGVVAVSGDYVTTNTPGTGLRTVYHISSGAPTTPVIDRQYGPIVGTVDSYTGGHSSAYLARFIPGTMTNQENVTTTSVFMRSGTQYGPASFTFTDIKGLAVGAQEEFNDVFMLFPRSVTFGDNNVVMVHEGSSTGTSNPGTVIRAGLSSAIAAATSDAPFNGFFRSYLWVLTPNPYNIVEYKCSATAASCSVVMNAPVIATDPYIQVVAASDWVAGDPD